jgi:hypothetical protein
LLLEDIEDSNRRHRQHPAPWSRKQGAPCPRAGHGICTNLSRSVTLPRFTGEAAELGREGRALLRAVGVPACDIRGVGLTARPPPRISGTQLTQSSWRSMSTPHLLCTEPALVTAGSLASAALTMQIWGGGRAVRPTPRSCVERAAVAGEAAV